MKNIVILISGRGSTMHAIVSACQQNILPTNIQAVISNQKNAQGLQIAKACAIPTYTIPNTNNQQYNESTLKKYLDKLNPQYIVLAGFMRILSPSFTQHYRGQIINIHPSLLPKFKELNTHQQALDNKQLHHGTTTHFVNEKLDDGPLIMQATIKIKRSDTPQTLANRLLPIEHTLYIETLKKIFNNQIQYKNERVYFNNQILQKPINLSSITPLDPSIMDQLSTHTH